MTKIGPLALHDGLQLRAPEGSAGGILRGINIELRDGAMRTRRGSEIICGFRGIFAPLGVTGAAFLNGAAGVASPAMGGKNQLVFALTGNIAPGCDVGFSVAGNDPNFNTNQATVSVQYLANDDTWKSLVIVDFNTLMGLRDPENTIPLSTEDDDGSGSEFYYFVAPEDWTQKTFNVLTGLGFTFRISFSVSMSVSSEYDVGGGVVLAPVTPTAWAGLKYIRTRASAALWVAVTTADGDSSQIGSTSRIAAAIGFMDLFPTGGISTYAVDLLYVPYTDAIIMTDGAGARVLYDPTSETVDSFIPRTLANPDPTREAFPEYSDIPLENTLGSFTVMGMFAGRVFIGGIQGQPGLIRWSAPEDAWEHWPSANSVVVGSAAAGAVVGFAEHGGALYIFTDRDVFIAQIAEGSGDNESDIFLERLEETGCRSGRSIVVCDTGVAFMSNDGPRIIKGRGPSKVLAQQVRDLFRPDGTTEFACLRKDTCCGCWDSVENRLLFAYSSPGATTNDTVLVIDLDDKTAWLWGAPMPQGMDSVIASTQRARGLRIVSMAWDPSASKVAAISQDGLLFYLSGDGDFGMPIPSSFETQTLRFGRGDLCTVERVELTMLRDHWKTVDVGVIPDGDVGRIDSRSVRAEPDRLDTTSAIGEADLAGEALSPLVESYGPGRWRGRKRCRNFRVRVASTAPTHYPIAVVALEAEFSEDGGKR